jgi:hypothetical protein
MYYACDFLGMPLNKWIAQVTACSIPTLELENLITYDLI